MSKTTLLPFSPTRCRQRNWRLCHLARYSGHTHQLYAYQLRRWFAWCETNGLDPLVVQPWFLYWSGSPGWAMCAAPLVRLRKPWRPRNVP